MATPTIGRKVYFRPDPVNSPELIYDATVCAVFEDGAYVNLAINDSLGFAFARQCVTFVQDGAPAPDYPYAHWMPYQVQQHSVANATPPAAPVVDLVAIAARAAAAADVVSLQSIVDDAKQIANEVAGIPASPLTPELTCVASAFSIEASLIAGGAAAA